MKQESQKLQMTRKTFEAPYQITMIGIQIMTLPYVNSLIIYVIN